MPAELRKWVNEVMIYDKEDSLSRNEAASFQESHQTGGWTTAVEGIASADELSDALDKFINVDQISFSTHGFPGGVWFRAGSLTLYNLKSVTVPVRLWNGTGRLLFMGCETGRGPDGEKFLIEAGKHFFVGRGGIVGGSTVYNLGFSSGTVLPVFGPSSDGFHLGKLLLYKIDAKGNVIGSSSTQSRTFGLGR
jgi:hypothetical protein